MSGAADLAVGDRAVPAGRHARAPRTACWRATPRTRTLIDQHIGTLDEGIADGRTAAAVPVRQAIEQIDRMLAVPADGAPRRVHGQRRRRVGSGARRARRSSERTSIPACSACATTWPTTTPRTPRPPRLSATRPAATTAYRLAIRMQTTVAATAEEVHAFGMEDLEHDRGREGRDRAPPGPRRPARVCAPPWREDPANRT